MNKILKEWMSKKRRMGCVAATKWFCKRCKNFSPLRIIRYKQDGQIYHHVVAYNGLIQIDLAPYNE